MIGLFINTLPVRVQVELRADIWRWLQQLQEQQSEARQYDYTPLVNILEWSDVPHGQELFESLLVFENYPIDEALKGGIQLLGVQDVKIVEQANYPLIARLAQFEAGLSCTIIYDSARLLPTTIERLLGHWHHLLEGLVTTPAASLIDLPLLTDAERDQILVEWNATASAYPAEQSLPQLFAEQVEQAPEAIALVFEDEHLTYQELNQRANLLACHLRELGVGPEVMVGIFLERSVAMIVGLLGILKAGGAYVPLDPSSPRERLAYMIGEARLSLCLTQRKMVERLPDGVGKLLCLDDEELSKGEGQQQTEQQLRAANLAYVMYTSGSTGHPKGVCVTHRNIVRLVKQTNYASFSAEDVFLQFAPLAFDASTLEIWGSLLNGARLVVAPAHTLTLEELKQVLEAHQISTLWLTSGLFHQMIEHHLEQLVAVRQVLAGGDILSVKHVREFLAQPDKSVLINGYGPTENTTFTCCYPMVTPSQLSESVPIGRPIANTQVYILNAHLQPVPVGIPGELYIGGDGLSRGYLSRADLTAERFVPNPFVGTRFIASERDLSPSLTSPQPGERLYKTGDLVRYTADGTIEFLGRLDYQVKLRGFRIELEEIEAALGQHPAVKQAVVVVFEDEGKDKHLVAYVVGNDATATELSQDILRAHLQEKLPSYMVPAFIILLDVLPLTRNGKVDRRALPSPEFGQPDSKEGHVAPRTQIEELLAEIWREVLKCSSAGVHDNFFEVGGHSLLAMRLIAQVRETFQVEMPISSLFEAPTLAGLGRLIEERLRQDGGSQVPPLRKRRQAEQREAPLSFAQQRLWFLDQLQPDSASYNISYAVQLHGQLDMAALKQSVQVLLGRHEILRTSFVTRQGEPIQRIEAPESARLVVAALDLRGLEPALREQVLWWLVDEEARQPFDLRHAPLWRVRVVLVERERAVLLSTLHHIVADGWSMQVLVNELTCLYNGYVQQQPASLATLPIQYADYAAWQREWLQGAVLEEQMRYWTESLQGVKPLVLPTDYPRPAVLSDRGAQVGFELPKDVSEGLQAFSHQEGVTLFMALLAAFSVLLARYSGQTDIVVGTPIATRTRAETEGLIGLFVNTLALRVDLSGNPTFRQTLSKVRKIALGAYAHQDIPFEKVVEAVHPERDLSRSPLVQVAFVLQSALDEKASSIELSGLTGDALAVEIHTNARDIILLIQKTEQGLRGDIRYNIDLFEEQTIHAMIERFKTMLTEIIRDPEWPVFAIPLFSEQRESASLERFSMEDAGDEDRFSFEETYS